MLRDVPGNRPPYEVRETTQFDADWRREIQMGNLNPMVAPSDLLFIKMLLAQQPYLGRWQPGTPYDSRTIALARVFEIGYYAVEDDQAVYLDSISFIGGN